LWLNPSGPYTEGHYLPDGTVECRIVGGTSEKSRVAILAKWPAFSDFEAWAKTESAKYYDDDGYDAEGYNAYGYNAYGYDDAGYDAAGYDDAGYDDAGYDDAGYNADGYDADGYDDAGCNADGIKRA
jgi:hypothetical protein